MSQVPAGPAPAVASALPCLPVAFARRHGVLLSADGQALQHRADTPLWALAEARRLLPAAVVWQPVDDEQFEHLLQQAYRQDSASAMGLTEAMGQGDDLARLVEGLDQTEDLLDGQDDAPIVRLINALLGEAVSEQASDIHIETYEKRLVVRFRVDGVLRDVVQPRRELAALLVSRIKVMARLDIAEKRLPQDGRLAVRLGNREVDVRVSTLPSANGERVVLRLLDKQAQRFSLPHLGMGGSELDAWAQMLQRPHGILLVTGPTGSGKSTTLYASLGRIDHRTRNILTVEDPIEYHLDGIGQTPVNPRIDMTFARGLRAILRQDPDVVMVGEIRDRETAQIAVQASLTGHLVLSTLHTNSAVGAITRLLDMGVEDYLLTSTINAILAQRLVRRLDPVSAQRYRPSPEEIDRFDLRRLQPEGELFLWKAVPTADNPTGYRGRTTIVECLVMDDALRAAVMRRDGMVQIEQLARQQGMRTMFEDGLLKALRGQTTLEEVLRVTEEG